MNRNKLIGCTIVIAIGGGFAFWIAMSIINLILK